MILNANEIRKSIAYNFARLTMSEKEMCEKSSVPFFLLFSFPLSFFIGERNKPYLNAWFTLLKVS